MVTLTIPAQALARNINAIVGLSFKDDSANCEVYITANNKNDAISAVTKLWQGNSCIGTWEDTANGILDITYEADAENGKNYTLTVDFTVNGITQPTASTSGTYN
jgi:hypothetical protein